MRGTTGFAEVRFDRRCLPAGITDKRHCWCSVVEKAAVLVV